MPARHVERTSLSSGKLCRGLLLPGAPCCTAARAYAAMRRVSPGAKLSFAFPIRSLRDQAGTALVIQSQSKLVRPQQRHTTTLTWPGEASLISPVVRVRASSRVPLVEAPGTAPGSYDLHDARLQRHLSVANDSSGNSPRLNVLRAEVIVVRPLVRLAPPGSRGWRQVRCSPLIFFFLAAGSTAGLSCTF